MQEQPCAVPQDQAAEVEVSLRGGPDGMPDRIRMAALGLLTDTIKIPFRNGYEHFTLASEIAAATMPTFNWTMRTQLAE